MIKIAAFFFVSLFFVIAFSSFEYSNRLAIKRPPISRFNGSPKLLGQAMKKKLTQPSRIGEECSPDYIVIYTGASAPLPNGIPTYTVRILNKCLDGGCKVGKIHLACGWYSSFRLVNPRIFRRLDYNDCLVNDGRPIAGGQVISFQYANSFPYPLSLSSATCL